MKETTDRNNAEKTNFAAQIEPFLRLELENWSGLPLCTAQNFVSLLSNPSEVVDTTLGAFPAKSYFFANTRYNYDVHVYERHGNVLLVEVTTALNDNLLSNLGEPCEILPQELFVEGAYAHEFLYCEKGLLITVLQFFEEDKPREIVRIRTFKALKEAEELNSELYFPLDNQINW